MDIKRKKITAILGSTRQQSVNRVILQSVKIRYADAADILIYDKLDTLPHFNPDLLDNIPTSIREFYNLIEQADGVLICSPEYVFSLPGSLKNVLEWTVSTMLFTAKPLALIVASSLGEKAFESLQLIMNTLGAETTDATSLLVSGSNSKLEKETQTLEAGVIKQLDDLMTAFLNTIDP